MKKIAKILAVMAVALTFSLSASAQDMAQATEMYNAAIEAYGNGDATAALDGFQKALAAAPAQIAQCQQCTQKQCRAHAQQEIPHTDHRGGVRVKYATKNFIQHIPVLL